MKKIFSPIIFLFLLLNLLFIAGCNKEEVADKTKDEFVSSIIGNITSNNLETNVSWLQNYGTRFFLANNRRQIAFDIKNKFIQLGYSNAHIDSFYLTANWDEQTTNTWQYNVIAELKGSITPDNIYVMGAHYDCVVDEGDPYTKAPGANDNASGVAAVIEVARVLKAQSFIPKNTIEFVTFAAEENDLNGSADFAGKAANSSKNIIAMLNNDMIATATGAESSWTVNIADYDNSSTLRSDFVACGERYTSLNFANDNSYNDESDSYSFSQQGFKVIFLIGNEDDGNYHTTNDMVSNCNFDFCREVTKLSCAYLVQEN
jgi:Zn-dependent M28 family amino/carboxypeptidase